MEILNPKLEGYLQELPRELVKAVKPLSNATTLGLFICIMKEGPFRFTELKNKFEIHQEPLTKALNSLMMAGLIERVTEISENSFAEVNYYEASPLGKSIMRSMVKGALFIDSKPDCKKRTERTHKVESKKQNWNITVISDDNKLLTVYGNMNSSGTSDSLEITDSK